MSLGMVPEEPLESRTQKQERSIYHYFIELNLDLKS